MYSLLGFTITNPDTVRPNIMLDNNLVEAGLKAKTPRELVDIALRELLRHKQQQKILSLKVVKG